MLALKPFQEVEGFGLRHRRGLDRSVDLGEDLLPLLDVGHAGHAATAVDV